MIGGREQSALPQTFSDVFLGMLAQRAVGAGGAEAMRLWRFGLVGILSCGGLSLDAARRLGFERGLQIVQRGEDGGLQQMPAS